MTRMTEPATTKGQRTATRVLDAAEALFARNGYNATSLRDIASAAGIQQPGLYKHFLGKDDLYQQVCERALRPLIDVMEELLEHPVDPQVFRTLTGRMTDILAKHPHVARLLVRALLTDDQQSDVIAMNWLGKLFECGRRMNEKAHAGEDNVLLALQIATVFNVMFGFFWSSKLISGVLGQDADPARLLALQKDVLNRVVGSFSIS